MFSIPVRVEFEDLVQGIINSPTSDPIALALQRAGLPKVIVGEHRISFAQGPKRVFADIPPVLQTFRRQLRYRDRFEALEVIRDKKGNVVGHKPMVATVHVKEAALQEAA